MNRLKFYITLIVVLFCTFIFSQKVFAETATTSTTTIPIIISELPSVATTSNLSTTGLQAPAIPLLISQIQQAKAKLAGIQLNHALSPVYKNIKNKKTQKTTKTLAGYTLSAKDIALAILDPQTNTIITTVGMQSGKTMSFPDPAVQVKLTYFNGVNSKFQISYPYGGQVIALKYLISDVENGSKSAIENSLSEAFYVPYSPGLSDPQVLKYGADYLNGIIETVTHSIEHIPSRSIPGGMITEAIPPAMIKALVYAEHTNTAQVLYGDVQDTINTLNTLFATNEGDTYKYSVSSAGARGIAQFMPGTYKGLVDRHPEAGLISDFVQGMADHINSIKAMYLLLDDYAGAVRVKATKGFAEGRIFDYGAASYNAGTTRVIKAVNRFGEDWNIDRSEEINLLQAQINSLSSQIKKTKDKKSKIALQGQLNAAKNNLLDLQSSTLKNETVNYLNKLYKVITMFNSQQI